MGDNYYWRGISADWENPVGTNWVDDAGSAWGAGNYPGTGDTAIFDAAVAYGPATNVDQFGVVLERLVEGKAFLRGVGASGTPLIISAKDISLDALQAKNLYLSSLPEPDAIVRPATSPLPKDYTTISSAIAGESAGAVIYVYEDDWGETNYQEAGALTINKDVELYAIGNVVIDGGGTIAGPGFSGTTTACLLWGFTIKNCAATNGGAILVSANDECTIQNCIIADCTASNNGGGIYLTAGSAPVFIDTTVSGCVAAGVGGGLYSTGSVATTAFTRCRFIGNRAPSGGAAYWNTNAIAAITNCLLAANEATTATGGAFHINNSGTTTLTLQCSTFADNIAATNGGAWFVRDGSDPSVRNCIFWGNTAGAAGNQMYLNDVGCVLDIDYCDVQGGSAAVGGVTGGMVYGGNNIDSDPLFLYDDDYDNSTDYTKAPTGASPRPLKSDYDVAAWYKLEATGDQVDFSGNGVTLAEQGTPVTAAGVYGNCIDFDGSTDVYRAGSSDELDITGDATIAMWINPDVGAGVQFVCGKARYDGAYIDCSYAWSYNHAANTADFRVSNTGVAWVSNNVAVPQSEWTHIVGVFDASAQTITLYKNGVYGSATATGFASLNSSGLKFLLGSRYGAADTPAGHFDGKIDELLILEEALTPAQVHDLYVAGHPDPYDIPTGSPCQDTGTNTGAPSTDLVHRARPVNADTDIGAYEYSTAGSLPSYEYSGKLGTVRIIGARDGAFSEEGVQLQGWIGSLYLTRAKCGFDVGFGTASALVETALIATHGANAGADVGLTLDAGLIPPAECQFFGAMVQNYTEIKAARIVGGEFVHDPGEGVAAGDIEASGGASINWMSGDIGSGGGSLRLFDAGIDVSGGVGPRSVGDIQSSGSGLILLDDGAGMVTLSGSIWGEYRALTVPAGSDVTVLERDGV